MAETKNEKKQTNPLVYIGIGCFILLVILGVVGTMVAKFFAKGIISGVIESKTGVKTNLKDIENGKMTFTDSKTGAKVDIGTGKVPDTFPKDFPVYPGAKVTSSLSGAASGKNNGFWLTLSTGDALDKVTEYYKKQLVANGWTIGATYTAGDTMTETATKGTWNGSLSLTRGGDTKETQIVIILGEESPTPTASSSNE